jgi:hypothetical protein
MGRIIEDEVLLGNMLLAVSELVFDNNQAVSELEGVAFDIP